MIAQKGGKVALAKEKLYYVQLYDLVGYSER